MRIEDLKTLWMLRFEEIRKNEEEAAWGYQEILDQFLWERNKDEEIIALLSRLVHEEKTHEKLAAELIRIVHQNHPEYGTFSL